ncbi:hypothetical protein C1646_698811 [Rhizophagus diaphanus]|nr:hypothetical protein C1646_698811 [Rhizophagus diaphanus] [Rhizophagus sp. MUCL 43196]
MPFIYITNIFYLLLLPAKISMILIGCIINIFIYCTFTMVISMIIYGSYHEYRGTIKTL